MPLTKAQGLLLSNDDLLAGLIENEPKKIQLAEVLPFFPINGDTLRVERSSASDFGIAPLFDTVPVTVTEGVAVPTTSLEAKFELKGIVQNVVVNSYVSTALSAINSAVGLQIEAATRRLLYEFWTKFITGDETVNSQEFSGIRKLTPSRQLIQTNDTTNYFLRMLDLARLVGLVTANGGRPDVLYTGPLGYRNVLNAYFVAGLEPEYVEVEVPDAVRGSRRRRMLAYEGIPVYQDTNMPTNETVGAFSNGTSIYAMCLGRGGVYGIVPAHAGRKMIQVQEVLAATTAQTTYRVYWTVGVVLECENAIARLQLRADTGTA
jgi:hypothetical protein